MQFTIYFDTELGEANYIGDEGQTLTTVLRLATKSGREKRLICKSRTVVDHEHFIFDQDANEFCIDEKTGELIGKKGNAIKLERIAA